MEIKRNEYAMQEWKNLPDRDTPITAERLKHIESALAEVFYTRALVQIYNDSYLDLNGNGAPNGSIVHGEGSTSTEQNSYSGGIYLRNGGACSHLEGSSNTINGGTGVHVEGYGNEANGSDYSHEEGYRNTINAGAINHVEGERNTVNVSKYGHVEGVNNTVSPASSSNIFCTHVEGNYNNAHGDYSHIEGASNTENVNGHGGYNHIEGNNNVMYGTYYSHMEGQNNKAGDYGTSRPAAVAFHVEGLNNVVMGQGSHVEGRSNKETPGSGTYNANHIEGTDNVMTGTNSYVHMSGYYNQSIGSTGGAVFGYNNILMGDDQIVCGKYNYPDRNMAFLVGGGSGNTERKNILELDWAGNFEVAGDIANGAGVSLNSLKSALETIGSVAAGASTAKVFDTKVNLDAWLAEEGNAETLTTGQNIYIVEKGTPDYWWDGTGLQPLETEKVELEKMTYDETMAVLNASEEVA